MELFLQLVPFSQMKVAVWHYSRMQELQDGMTGKFRLRTRTGSEYLICLDAPRHIIRFAGESERTPDYAQVEVAQLRKDTEAIPL